MLISSCPIMVISDLPQLRLSAVSAIIGSMPRGGFEGAGQLARSLTLDLRIVEVIDLQHGPAEHTLCSGFEDFYTLFRNRSDIRLFSSLSTATSVVIKTSMYRPISSRLWLA
jgi:hypothetical protein